MKTSAYLKLTVLLLVTIGVAVALGSRTLDAQDASTSSAFYDQLQRIRSVEKIKPFLDTEDPQNARLVIIRLVELDETSALPVLRALWAERDPSHAINHMDTYRHPIVRLTLAEQLMALSPAPEYGSYIKQAVDQDSWIVRSLAAEALAVVDESESVDLLVRLAHSGNPFVAESAVASLSRIARYGKHAAEASQAIEALHSDPRIKQERVKNKINEAYQGIDAQNPKSTDATIDQDRSLDQQIQPYLEKKQYRTAIDILLPAAEDGNSHAQHLAGELYLAMNPPDYDRAREWLLRAVMKDYAPAKTSLANLYLSGRGVEKDEGEAVRLLQDAEQQGDQSARLLLERARKHGWWEM
jgi:hypothetical protein